MTQNTKAQMIDYASLMHEAMRQLIRSVLEGVAQNGLPGAHHFYIGFDTGADGVDIAEWLRARYPSEMTIVIQNWYDALEVTPDAFSITLNFGDQPERLTIPFKALRSFADPSVEFGLRFEQDEQDEPPPEKDDRAGEEPPPAAQEESAAPRQEAEIVSLDKFRKR